QARRAVAGVRRERIVADRAVIVRAAAVLRRRIDADHVALAAGRAVARAVEEAARAHLVVDVGVVRETGPAAVEAGHGAAAPEADVAASDLAVGVDRAFLADAGEERQLTDR